MATKKDKDTETIRSKQHRELDEVYASRDPELGAQVVDSIEEPSGKAKRKALDIDFSDGVAVVDTNGEVRLDREGCLNAAKAFSRAAQAVA